MSSNMSICVISSHRDAYGIDVQQKCETEIRIENS